MNKEGFENFLFKILPEKIKNEREQILEKQRAFKVQKALKNPKGDMWDELLRNYFYETAIDLFKEKFPDKQAEEYIYVERKNTIPKRYREIKFMGATMAPDAALIDEENGVAVAIELDHGKTGSRVLNALSKASMSVLLKKESKITKGFDKAVLIFVDENGILKNYEQDKTYLSINGWFEKNLSTKVFIV